MFGCALTVIHCGFYRNNWLFFFVVQFKFDSLFCAHADERPNAFKSKTSPVASTSTPRPSVLQTLQRSLCVF